MPSDVPFVEIERVLSAAGYSLTRISGSHHIFTKVGLRSFGVPVHRGKAKAVYLRQARKLAGAATKQEEKDDQEKDSPQS